MEKSNIDKKYITNTITYTCNKKMSSYNEKLNSIIKMIEDLDKKINNLEFLFKKNKNELKDNTTYEKINLSKDYVDELQGYIIDKSQDNFIDESHNDFIDELQEDASLSKDVSLSKDKDVSLSKDKDASLSKDKDVSLIKSESINSFDNSLCLYREIKNEYFEVDDIFIKKCLNMMNVHGEIKLFRKIYIDDVQKEYYPIRHIKKKIQYWNNGHMVDDDSSGNYVKNTILKNIEECYLRVNIYDNYSNNIDQFLKNQEHIKKLSEQKYKDKFLLKIIEIISI